ncbi:hypothetical protein AGMMS50225_24670 [Betaproteobacteria bacterium]|nr:hypothetical protein AGMMS50225_24670 [Betaproteobacteria bacterium]
MAMSRDKIARLLVEARNVTNHQDYVIIGSLSVLGAFENPPDAMTVSIDVDLYPKNDSSRASDVAQAVGENSWFEKEFGYYADAVSPALPALPDGWADRLMKVDFESGVTAWFLDLLAAEIQAGKVRDLPAELSAALSKCSGRDIDLDEPIVGDVVI